MNTEARRAARELLAGELSGGRWLLAPRPKPGTKTARQAVPDPAPESASGTAGAGEGSASSASGEMAERLKKFREQKTQRQVRDAAAAEAAARAAEAPLPKGIAARHEASIFGSAKLTDPALPPGERLEQMRDQVAACTRCAGLASTRKQTVFGDGRPGAELVFVGEAPGADEDAQGVPFVGRAGQLLNKIIAAMGLERGGVYICNVLKCRPPNNRTPLPSEAANCWPFLSEQLEILKPRVICALGSPAARTLLGTEESIGRLRGAVHDFHGTPLVATYHPAYLLRSPGEKPKVWEDMKMVLRILGRPVPERSARS